MPKTVELYSCMRVCTVDVCGVRVPACARVCVYVCVCLCVCVCVCVCVREKNGGEGMQKRSRDRERLIDANLVGPLINLKICLLCPRRAPQWLELRVVTGRSHQRASLSLEEDQPPTDHLLRIFLFSVQPSPLLGLPSRKTKEETKAIKKILSTKHPPPTLASLLLFCPPLPCFHGSCITRKTSECLPSPFRI